MRAIPHRVYEDMVRSHQRREAFYVMTINSSHELLESFDWARCLRSTAPL